MPTLREIEIWPDSGFADQPWSRNRDEDAFARISRSICETYSVALPPLHLTTKASVIRLDCIHPTLMHINERPWPQLSDPPTAAFELMEDFFESFELGSVWVPHGFADETIPAQKQWTLAIIHEAARRIVEIRGNDPTTLNAALTHTHHQGLRYLHQGPWKSAPTRRHKARACARIEDNGMGAMWLEIVDAAGTLVAQGDPIQACCDGSYLVRACKLVTWSSRTTVSAAAPQNHFDAQTPLHLALT